VDSTAAANEPKAIRVEANSIGVYAMEAVGGFPVAVEDFKKVISNCLPERVSRAISESVAMSEAQGYASRFLGDKIVEAVLAGASIPDETLDAIGFSPREGYVVLSVFGFETNQVISRKETAEKMSSAIEKRIEKLSAEEYDVENKMVNDPKIESLSRAKRDLESSFEPPSDGVEKPND
jgi:hypothetical protein